MLLTSSFCRFITNSCGSVPGFLLAQYVFTDDVRPKALYCSILDLDRALFKQQLDRKRFLLWQRLIIPLSAVSLIILTTSWKTRYAFISSFVTLNYTFAGIVWPLWHIFLTFWFHHQRKCSGLALHNPQMWQAAMRFPDEPRKLTIHLDDVFAK